VTVIKRELGKKHSMKGKPMLLCSLFRSVHGVAVCCVCDGSNSVGSKKGRFCGGILGRV
jgi:hypothetical protein